MCRHKYNLKKPPLLIAQVPNNAQNTQQKLGVAFSNLERNYRQRPNSITLKYIYPFQTDILEAT